MDVFLIPTAANRYELYCEIPDNDDADSAPPSGFFRGLIHQFRQALADAERERHRTAQEREADDAIRPSFYQRVKRQVLCRIAESIAEQRLLWHLRRQDAASAIYPDDVTSEAAEKILRASMQADFEKHRRWLVIDGVLLVASGVLVVLPGPNLLAYYLAFRVVGHYLSMRGARQALVALRWHYRPSALLAELRQAISLEPPEREARVSDIAARLRLERLTTFFARTAVPSA